MQVTKSKHKLAWLKPILLTLAFIFMFTITPNIEAHASYSTMTENDGAGKGSTEILGGPTYYRTGWTFYLLDMNGNRVGDAHAATVYDAITDRAGNAIPQSNIYVAPRIGAGVKSISIADAPWGPPFAESGAFRGDEICDYLLTADANGHKRAANLIRDTWGTENAKKWENKELALVFEPFFWYHMYITGPDGRQVGSGKWICSTVRWLGLIQLGMELEGLMEPTGSSKINAYTNINYPNCMVVHPDPILGPMNLQPAPHGGLVTNREMGWADGSILRTCWGMGMVINDTPAINTYSPEEGSPGFPEDPIPDKVGASNIVKGYYTENLTTGVKTSDGTFTRKETTNLININDEPNYELVHWDISTSEPIEPNPTNWNPPAVVESGTTPTTVELEPEQKTLYVLLKRVEGDPPESNDDWVLEESEITKWVETGDKVKDESVTYTLPALNTCSGHEVSVKKYGDHSEACDPSCTSSHSYYDTETKYCDKFTLSDKTIKSVLININEDSATNSRNVLAKDGSYFKTRHTKDPSTDTRTSTSEGTLDTKGYNYEFIIHRLNKDKLTLLKYEPSPDSITPVKTLGTQYSIKEADVTSKTRYKGAEYIEKIKLILETDNGLSELKTTATGNISNHKKEAEATSNNAIEFDGDVTIKVYHLFS